MAKGALRFKNMTVGKQKGELARFRVLGGPDSGVVFVVTAARVTLGRGDENDIVLADLKASRKHAELSFAMGQVMLKDLGSTHGFMVNGTAQKSIQLSSGDKIGIGETVLEFIASQAGGATQMIVRPPVVQPSRKVGTGNSGLTQFIQRPTPGAAASGVAGANAQHQGFLEKNKKLVLVLGLLMAASWMLPEVENKIRKPASYLKANDSLSGGNTPSALIEPEYDSPAYKSADIYYKLGMRELRAKNYMRAMANFETAMQIYERHPLARIYIETTKKDMKTEADEHKKIAKQDEEASRYRGALNHYNAIKRMYTNDQSNDQYKAADAKIVELEKKIKELEKN